MTKKAKTNHGKKGFLKLFASARFEKIVFTSLCLWALSIQMKYRVSASFLFLLLPWIGIALAAMSLFILIDAYIPSLFANTPFKKTLNKIEWGTQFVIRIFVYYSLFLLGNGLLDLAPPRDRTAKIESIYSGEWNLDLPIPYQLATLSFSDSEEKTHFLLNARERRRLWGGESVVIVSHAGYFGLPWISRIEQDVEIYSKKILALTPTASGAWRNLIQFYMDHERWPEAGDTTQDYLNIYPNDDAFALNVAGTLNVAGQYSDGIPILEHIVGRRPTYKAYQLLGYALSWSGKRARAAMFLEKSIPLNPVHWEAYYHLGYVYYDSGKLKKAEENFIKLLERRPHFPEIEKMLADVRHINKLKEKIRKRKAAEAAKL
ncbi:MAG: tetratricopeptide repeat protein [Nitrospirae bacterium]|nr:tetratricopeptide repeat protein [Candidatus Manganitrophaceae bacterium]